MITTMATIAIMAVTMPPAMSWSPVLYAAPYNTSLYANPYNAPPYAVAYIDIYTPSRI